MMKILAFNHISLRKRMIEFLFDYLLILTYLVLLFLCAISYYYIFLMAFQGKQKFKHRALHFLSLFYQSCFISHFWIMKKMGVLGSLKLDFTWSTKKKTVNASLIRNTIKFLPWQLGHMGTIHGVYSNFDLLSIILSFLATLFAVSLMVMTIFRKDKRHLGDLLAQTQVQPIGD